MELRHLKINCEGEEGSSILLLLPLLFSLSYSCLDAANTKNGNGARNRSLGRDGLFLPLPLPSLFFLLGFFFPPQIHC